MIQILDSNKSRYLNTSKKFIINQPNWLHSVFRNWLNFNMIQLRNLWLHELVLLVNWIEWCLPNRALKFSIFYIKYNGEIIRSDKPPLGVQSDRKHTLCPYYLQNSENFAWLQWHMHHFYQSNIGHHANTTALFRKKLFWFTYNQRLDWNF